MSDFDGKILFDNISYLLKKSGKKVGEFEAEAGVSTGYISRASKGTGGKPGIDFVIRASDVLGVSLDVLLKCNMTALTETEQYKLSFLDKLLRDTQNNKLNWESEKAEHLNSEVMIDERGICSHPLFEEKTFYEQLDGEYPEEITEIVFVSNYFGVHTLIEDDCYKLRINEDTFLFLMGISKRIYRPNDPNAHAKEIWMCSPDISGTGYKKSFLCGTLDFPEMSKTVEDLYLAVGVYEKRIKLDPGVKSIIDEFMGE